MKGRNKLSNKKTQWTMDSANDVVALSGVLALKIFSFVP